MFKQKNSLRRTVIYLILYLSVPINSYLEILLVAPNEMLKNVVHRLRRFADLYGLIYAPGSCATSGTAFHKIKWRILLEAGNEGKITFICWFGINKICLWVNGNRTKIIYHFLKIRLPVRSVKC